MNKQEIISIAFTAFVGLVFGIYVYFAGWLHQFGAPDVQTQAEVNSFTLVSEAYGGCRDACPSFRIASDGSYRYLFTPAIGEEQIVRDGSIPRRLKRDLLNVMNERTLEEQSFPIEPSFCNSYTDGIDVLYRITYSDEEYDIDTCGTAVDTNSRLWNTLVKTWNYFETGDY